MSRGVSKRRHLLWLLPLLFAPALYFLLSPSSEEAVPPPTRAPDLLPPPAAGPAPAPREGPAFDGTIEGRVTRKGKGSVADLTLRLHHRLPGRDVRTAKADAMGEFVFTGVPAGRHEIAAVGPGGSQVRKFLRLDAQFPRTRVELELPAGPHALRGRAVYASGRPFLGRVEVRPEG